MKRPSLIALSFLLTASPFAAKGDSGHTSNKAGVTTTNQQNPGAPISPGKVNNGKPNSGAQPMPGYGGGGNPGSAATPSPGSSGENVSNNRPQGPGDPATEMQRSSALEISFAPGASTLSDEEKQRVNQLLEETRRRGPLTHVKVLSWGDTAYPAKKAKTTKEDRELAEKRNEILATHISASHNDLKVESYNMASALRLYRSYLMGPTPG